MRRTDRIHVVGNVKVGGGKLQFWFLKPSFPNSSEYLVRIGVFFPPPKGQTSGGVCGSKHLLTRYLED